MLTEDEIPITGRVKNTQNISLRALPCSHREMNAAQCGSRRTRRNTVREAVVEPDHNAGARGRFRGEEVCDSKLVQIHCSQVSNCNANV